MLYTMTYKLLQQLDGLHLLTTEGQEVPLTALLPTDTKIVCFDGPMGVGKTTLIKSLCGTMGVTDYVNSPSFALVNEYTLPDNEPLYHFDLYRVKDLRELYDMGFEEYLYSTHWCFIEWPDIAESLLPDETTYIHLTLEGTERYLTR